MASCHVTELLDFGNVYMYMHVCMESFCVTSRSVDICFKFCGPCAYDYVNLVYCSVILVALSTEFVAIHIFFFGRGSMRDARSCTLQTRIRVTDESANSRPVSYHSATRSLCFGHVQ
jgi:hypothetical protein